MYVHSRGGPISKLTDILLTDIAIGKSIDSDTDITALIDSSLLLLQNVTNIILFIIV